MSTKKVIAPLNEAADNPAANLVRTKLKAIYGNEPEVIEEEKEIAHSGVHSKHQRFLAELMASDKTIVEIQSAWHEYYKGLSDTEKHEVWQEFYENSDKIQTASKPQSSNHVHADTITAREESSPVSTSINTSPETMEDLRKKILRRVNADGKLKTKHHLKSIGFSLAFASLATGLMFFITNNERFIVPFIQPSSNVSAAPIITDGSQVSAEAKIIIPKINLEAPLVTDLTQNSEEAIQEGLERGVTLYPDTGKPGEIGNPTFFGHSSNNLFNRGAYKFVFVRLHQLEVGDTYAINYNGKQYVYKIFSRDVVTPDRVDILYARPREVMSTLITCDPPGTSNYRLVLHAEQISPDPGTNVASTVPVSSEKPAEIPSNAPSLLSRLFGL